MTRFLTGPILFCSPYVPDDPIVAEFAATVDNDVVAVGDANVVAVEANGPVAEPITETQIDH